MTKESKALGPVTAPKGTYDILPEEQPVRRWIVAVAEAVFSRYGYGRIDTPTFEETKLFVRGVGEATDLVRKEMYTFRDLGGRSLTLRPEGTAPVARAYLEHGMHTLPQPVKVYYHLPMFRYESPQSGRYRQHYQLGVEAFGSALPAVDAEVIGVLAALYAELGLSALELRINSMGCRECRPGYAGALRSFLETWASALCGECIERTRANPLRTFDCKVEGCRNVLQEAPHVADYLCPSCTRHHEQVQEYLSLQGIAFTHDHALVRGLDYYTRTTFEYQSALLGAQAGVGGGGRYDNLVECIGGFPVPGVGFGTGVERILLALSRSRDDLPGGRGPLAYVVAIERDDRPGAFEFAHLARRRGVAVDLDHMERSAKGQMKQAGRCRARFAVILGPEEREARLVTLRDLATGEERRLSREEALSRLAREEESRR